MNERRSIIVQRGVTLVEILIVLTIAAMVAGIIVLNAPPARSDVRDAAEQFAARLDYTAQSAITSGALFGMSVSESGYEFYRYDRGAWAVMSDGAAGGDVFPADFALELSFEDKTGKNNPLEQSTPDSSELTEPNVTFAPTGETTPFEIVFRERRETIRVSLDGGGRVELTRDEND